MITNFFKKRSQCSDSATGQDEEISKRLKVDSVPNTITSDNTPMSRSAEMQSKPGTPSSQYSGLKSGQHIKISTSLKTVKKWEKELNIPIGYELQDEITVVKYWCVICREFSKDSQSAVSFICLPIK